MKKYRIKKEKSVDKYGRICVNHYPQKRCVFGWWVCFRDRRTGKVCFPTMERALVYIKGDISDSVLHEVEYIYI